ncbi:MAG TPA: phosphoglycerate kinase [Bacilli bacterium]|nr:phosphoglycerate kinase [Bacilli bacterium]
MIKTIKEIDLKNRTIILRCDFNVPIKNNKIIDDNRIKESLDTIKYILSQNSKLIILSHLGRVETKEDMKDNTLFPVAKRLEKYLKKKIIFCEKNEGKEVEETVNSAKYGDVILLENTRYQDINNKRESSNDTELGKYWASLGDIFVNDAFGTAHRAHASNVGIATYIPSAIGFLVEKELKMLKEYLNNPKKPYTILMGGAKIKDKIGVIENLSIKADNIIVGGGIAYTFLKAEGYNTGTSIVDNDNIMFCKNMLSKYGNKIFIPNYYKYKSNNKIKTIDIRKNNNDKINFLDISNKSIKEIEKIICKSKTIFWNGPFGYIEDKNFIKGTKKIMSILSKQKVVVILGGGDITSVAVRYGYKNKFTHVSTGGGASLELLEGKILPGIEIIGKINTNYEK